MADITHAGAPSKHTVGKVGDIYTDSITGRQWKCIGIYHVSTYHGPETTYEWDEIINEGDGSGGSDGHNHTNKVVLDKLSQNSDGNLLFGGSEINGGGEVGADGKSAYEIAVDHGFEGDEEEWLESLRGENGADGATATIKVFDYSTLTSTTFDLYPNKVYNLGTRDNVTINFLAPEDETALSLYTVSIVGGDAVVAPTFQRNGVEITIDKGTSEFVAGGKYEFSYNWADAILIAQ